MVEEEDPDLLVLQLLAADQLGHVRGVRNPEYLDQIADTDRHVGDFLELPRRARQARRRHRDPDGRPRPGPRHRRPRPPRLGRAPGAVRGLGAGRAARRRQPRAALGLRAGPRPSQRFWAWRPRRRRGAGRWCPCSTPASSGRLGRPRARRRGGPRRGAGRGPACCAGLPRAACGLPVDVLLVDDGSRDATPPSAASTARAVISHEHSRGLGAALRAGLEHARDERLRRRRLPRRRRRVRPGRLRARARARSPAGGPTTCSARASSGAREGMSWHRNLANRVHQRAGRHAHAARSPSDAQSGYRAFSARALASARIRARLQLRPGAHACRSGGLGIEPVEVPIVVPPPDERALVRALPGVPGARGARGLARVARLEGDQEERHRRRSRRRARTARRRAREVGEQRRSAGRTARPGRPATSAPPKSRASA